MNLIPFVSLWILLALAIIALLVWRKMVSSKEDDNLHVLGEVAQLTADQTATAQKLALIDKWGKIVTVVAVVYGLILGGVYVWQSWIQNSKIGA